MLDVLECMQESCGQAAAADRTCLLVTCACGMLTFRSSLLCTHPQMHNCQLMQRLLPGSIVYGYLSAGLKVVIGPG